MKRLAFTATTAVIFSAALGAVVYLAWQAAKAGWYFFAGSLALGAVVLWILAGVAIEEATGAIRRRGYSRRVGATGGGGSMFGLIVPMVGNRNRDAGNVFYYALRENGSKGTVSETDIYKMMLGHHVGDTILQQWHAENIGRVYLDDIRAVCIAAGVVRQKGNGALVLLYPPHLAIEQIYRHFYN